MTEAPVATTDLALPESGDLTERPAYYGVDADKLALIKAQIAPPNGTEAELAYFIELCAMYGLDPFAKEAWFAKSKNGKLLIMVGRDGLRKIASNNGVHVDGDVVREKDELRVTRDATGNRTVEHSWLNPAQRGAVIGAWAECREGGPLGRPLGFFYAPIEEYKPASIDAYSPWGKQEGVMILAAAERQAIRQATPLGGLLTIGEDDTIRDNESRGSLTAGVGSGETPHVELGDAVEHVLSRAYRLGHVGLADRGTAEMALADQPDEFVAQWVADAGKVLDKIEAEGEVVDGEATDDEPEQLRADAAELRREANAAEDDDRAAQLVLDADLMDARADEIEKERTDASA